MSSPMSYASPSSPGLYVPVHRRRRTPGYASSSESGTPMSSPSSSARSLSPLHTPTPTPGVYTPDQLLTLSHSPLIAQMSAAHVEALRMVAPEVVQTRKQRKASAWWARQATTTQHTHRRTPSHESQSHSHSQSQSQSESEEDRAVSWRRT